MTYRCAKVTVLVLVGSSYFELCIVFSYCLIYYLGFSNQRLHMTDGHRVCFVIYDRSS